MANKTVRSNPYQQQNGASSALFFGREAEFAQIQEILAQQQPNDSLATILSGPSRVGKTSLLKQIENGRFGPAFLPIYCDFQKIALDSLNSFCWDLAHNILTTATQHNVEIPDFSQTAFFAAPLQALHMQVLQPIAHALGTQRLLLLGDNLEAILPSINKGKLSIDIIESLHNELRQAGNASSLFVYNPLAASNGDAPPPASFLTRTNSLQIGPLSNESALMFTRQPIHYTIVHDVAQYIYDLTGGYPAELQKLCSALFERQQKDDLTHITVADVALVKKQLQKQKGKETAVFPHHPTYTIQPHPHLDETIQQKDRHAPLIQQPLFWIGIIALLFISASILIPFYTRQQAAKATIANITATANANQSIQQQPPTITNSPTSIAQPTQTAPSATPPPPESAAILLTETATSTATSTPSPTPTPTQTPDKYPETIIRSQDNMPMNYIPAATFLMGSIEGEFLSAADEIPQRNVTLDAFYIDQFEVNIEQYAAFLNQLGTYQRACSNINCTLPQHLAGYTSYLVEQDLGDGTVQYVPVTGFANYPANHVSWHGANSYCNSVGARLPTEAEWEYAARGEDGRLYPWGNLSPDDTLAIFQSETFDNMKPVDALPDGASPFNIYGMAGSLWEWTADWYKETYYQEAPDTNPLGPETGFSRSVRGGAWPFNNQAERIRTTNRFSLAPDFISSTVGFRCAQNP